MLRICILFVAMTSVAITMEIPITRHWQGGFQSEFCYPVPQHLHGWTAHVVFDVEVDRLEQGSGTFLSERAMDTTYFEKIYDGDIVSVLEGGKEFVVVNKPYNADQEAGDELCIKFTARVSGDIEPTAYFYIEGIDNPVDTDGQTHAMPLTTRAPELTNANILWSLSGLDPALHDILSPFNTQSEGHFDEGSLTVVPDPVGLPGSVLRCFYQKGAYVNVHSHRGAQFYGRPTQPRTSMLLSYDIYFSPGFDFVKGGKLPGLFGGATNCSGGRHSDACFSTRLMWRTNGDGEVYAYIPTEQVSEFCNIPDNHCNFEYGNSLGRGAWRFVTGRWQNIAQHITLNTPVGIRARFTEDPDIWYNGQPVLEVNDLNFRNKGDIQVEGIFFSTFFGGSDSSWVPSADCYTYYKNFVIADDAIHPAVIG